jgi:MFS family permease
MCLRANRIMVGLFSFYVNLGSIIGSVVDNYTKHHLSKLSYRIPLACMFIVPLLLSISLFFVPESPRWLLHHDRADAARKSLEKLRVDHGDRLELEWAEMVRGVAEEQRVAKSSDWRDMYRGNDLRRTLLCYATIAAQSASGVWFFIGYQTYFLTLAGITKAFEYTIMITCIGFIGVHVGLFSLNKVCGRRTVMIVGAISCGLCELACGIAYSVAPTSKSTGNVLVAFTALFMFCYNAGVGVASSPLATEMVSSRLRASTVGSANALGYFLAWLVGFCSPYFINPEELNWVSPSWWSRKTIVANAVRDPNTRTYGQLQTSSASYGSTSSFRKQKRDLLKSSTRFSRPAFPRGSSRSTSAESWRRPNTMFLVIRRRMSRKGMLRDAVYSTVHPSSRSLVATAMPKRLPYQLANAVHGEVRIACPKLLRSWTK